MSNNNNNDTTKPCESLFQALANCKQKHQSLACPNETETLMACIKKHPAVFVPLKDEYNKQKRLKKSSFE
jgi:hypothetical protein